MRYGAGRLEKYDLIIGDWTPYARFIRDIKGPRKVIVAHNIESTIWEKYQRNETNPLKKFYIGVQYRKVLAFERSCFSWADGARR